MSDFLAVLSGDISSSQLKDLLLQQFTNFKPQCSTFNFSGASGAILEETFSKVPNFQSAKDIAFGWIGDFDLSAFEQGFGELIETVRTFKVAGVPDTLAADPVFKKLNVAFAAFFICDEFLAIITDPFGFVPVYISHNSNGQIAAVSTNIEAAAKASNNSQLDIVSAAHYLDYGSPGFPFTMYSNVQRLMPGRYYHFKHTARHFELTANVPYWSIPAESHIEADLNDCSDEIRSAIVRSVNSRCSDSTNSVLLSGGLDSRLILSVMDPQKKCIALSFCDRVNREIRTARSVAASLNRELILLLRDNDYVSRNIENTTRLIGCENDWIHAHSVGFASAIREYGVSTIFHGFMLGCFIRSTVSFDITRIKRLGGLLPYDFSKNNLTYVRINPFAKPVLNCDLARAVIERKELFFNSCADLSRKSTVELLNDYPVSHTPENSICTAERKLLPLKIPAADRDFLTAVFKFPVTFRASGELYNRVIAPLFGPTAAIKNSNNGIRPGSSHLSAIMQRSLRKIADANSSLLETLGFKKSPEHSWHDYQQYWNENASLQKLKYDYAPMLKEFEGVLINRKPEQLLFDHSTHWKLGFRLLQFAIWRAQTGKTGIKITPGLNSPSRLQEVS